MEARHKSMLALGKDLASPEKQLGIINKENSFSKFAEKYFEVDNDELKTREIEIFQVNLGKMCNQVCKHCHVDAGPDRKEIMTRETMQLCLDALAKTDIQTVDLTGGAPEMNPDFKWFVTELKKLNKHILVRSNLTILVANGYEDYPKFLADNDVEIVSSLPFYKEYFTDKQRGSGVFNKSIKAMRILNRLGYGIEDSDLIFNLVYNPMGAFLPAAQESLERDYRRELKKQFDLSFTNLFTITNLPISRFLDYLLSSGNYKQYMEKLIFAFNPAAAANVMCKFTLSVGWNGFLYDCDFNQMLELTVNHGAPNHIRNFNKELLEDRKIITGQHCYGCTAGAGSSCGGETV